MTDCAHFDAFRCRSCALLETPYADQLAAKQTLVENLIGTDLAWQQPVASAQFGFRNKAKMVVGGTASAPTLGILGPDGGVDLRDCLLHKPGIQQALPELATFVSEAALEPYDVGNRRGELKHLLVTESPDGELMVRLVLRSQEAISRLRKHLPNLHLSLPNLRVFSANLQPTHAAVLEGDVEIVLSEDDALRMHVADRDLWLRPQSFFQTNTPIADSLYRTARDWIAELDPQAVWDLYCGVGGFALQAARDGRRVTGVEVSAEAVTSARRSADDARLDATFVAADAVAWAAEQADSPDLAIVNPPRRGIGSDLARSLEDSGAQWVLYSSCNAESLARDLAAMPSLRPERAVLLDMFPNTDHYEVLTLLRRDD